MRADKKGEGRENRIRCGKWKERTREPGQLIEICSRWGWQGGVSLGCARDDKLEGTKESIWVILAEMHGNEIWTLNSLHPVATQDPHWGVKDTNWTKNISTQNWACLLKIQVKRLSREWGNGQIIPCPTWDPSHGQAPIPDITNDILFYTSRE